MPDAEESITPLDRLHEVTELVRPISIRTAVELEVPEMISRGITSVADLAIRAGTDARALGKLLRYLHTVGILTETGPGRYGLTPLGEVLTNEFVVDSLHPSGVRGREMLGIHGLTESIRTGRPVYADDRADLRRRAR